MLYTRPKTEILKFEAEDVVRTSGEIDNIGSGELPKPDINYNSTQP